MSSQLSAPLRADAARNRDRVLRAAVEVFNDDGIEAGVEQIAHRAGVGVGTLYRRFPTKEALIGYLVDDMAATLKDMAAASLQLPDGRGLEAHLRTAADLFAENRGCLPRLWARSSAEQRARLQLLLQAAVDAGAVAPETTLVDVLATLWALRGIIESAGDNAADVCQRHLDLVFAGLRASLRSRVTR